MAPGFKQFLKILKWLAHPIFVFVILQFVGIALIVIWVIWFVDSLAEITKLATTVGVQYHLDTGYGLAMLIGGCILLGVLLMGTVLLFIFGQRQSRQMSQQKAFVSSVTHELRSPLASLQLAFETLQSRAFDANTTAKMHAIAAQDIERLSRLVNQILVSSRLDRGLLNFSEPSQKVFLREFIRKSCENLQWLDPSAKERVEIICAPELAIDAPPSVISLIITNLLENAIKYSPPQTPIKVLGSVKDDMLTIAVKDQGYGLNKREKEKIFRMFHRSLLTLKKAIPGTGLGLYMVRSLARAMGGQAWAESPGPQKGATFFVTLPLNRDQGGIYERTKSFSE